MILKYKKGDILTRVMTANEKFVISKYKTLNNSTTRLTRNSSANVPLKMIYTNDECIQSMPTEKLNIYISTTFTNDGVEKRIPNLGDLFIIGDKEETINKAKAKILIEHNTHLRTKCLTKE